MLLKQKIKQTIKHSDFLHNFLSVLIKLYLVFCYKTIRWQYQDDADKSLEKLIKDDNKIFIFWHNNLALAPYIFQNNPKLFALVSSHNDGRIISNIISKFNIGVISGSTNRDAVVALKQIVKALKNQNNIAITPDGPRGPVYKINSNITAIARMTKAEIISVAIKSDNHFCLNSWDKLIIPKPFSRAQIAIDQFLIYNDKDDSSNKLLLERRLIELNNSI